LDILRKRLAGRNIAIEISVNAKKHLAKDGYDPIFGARPLKRLIQKEIENPLAKRLLGGEFSDGDRIEVESNGETFSFTRVAGV